jgi:hypothetical protein
MGIPKPEPGGWLGYDFVIANTDLSPEVLNGFHALSADENRANFFPTYWTPRDNITQVIFRGWRGFHHHATLCIAAYGFLISQREKIPPSAPRAAAVLAKPALPAGCRPRGAADQAAAPRPQLNRHHASSADRRARPRPAAMPLLRPQIPENQAETFVAQ